MIGSGLKKSLLLAMVTVSAVCLSSCNIFKGVKYVVEDRMNADNSYADFRDEWNDYHSPRPDAGKIIKDVMTAAESGDKEKLRKLFSEEVQQKDGFEEQLDEFIKNVPDGLAELEYEKDRLDSGWGTDNGKLTMPITRHYKQINCNGKYYYAFMSGYAKCEPYPEKEGLSYFYIFDEAACAAFDYWELSNGAKDDTANAPEFDYSSHILIARKDIDLGLDEYVTRYRPYLLGSPPEYELTSRSVDGNAWLFVDFGNNVSADDFMNKSHEVKDINDIRDLFGFENGILRNDYCYELASDDENKQYGIVSCDASGRISYCYITDAEGSERVFDDEYAENSDGRS